MRKSSRKSPKAPKAAAQSDLNRYPKGWNRKRVQKVISHYENQTDEQAIAEDESAYHAPGTTMMQIPVKLIPAVQKLLAKEAG